jgi:excisionase family DNA binding protein
MTVEVTVTNPAYWRACSLQLAQLLRRVGDGDGPSTIGDPTGQPPDPDRLLAVSDPAYWSGQPRELQEVLAIAAQQTGVRDDAGTGLPGGSVGVASGSQARLTLTVEEAAAALGISRAFAYEAVNRNEIPHVRIGRRILVPRAALERMLGTTGKPRE